MMNNEELGQKIDFIVNHQAQFVVDMDKLREAQQETNQVVGRLAYVTNVGFKDVNAKIDALVDAQIATEERFKDTNQRFKETDAKLEALINSQIDTDRRFKETDAKLKALAESQKSLTDSQKSLTDSQKSLTDSQKSLTDSQKSLTDSQKSLDASHKLTEEALRKLSDTVDRYIRNRTNNGTG